MFPLHLFELLKGALEFILQQCGSYGDGRNALTERHRVEWHWVKGHSGHPENERVDKLASDAAEAIAG